MLNFETASTVEPDDPESVQRAARQAYATERSAVAVADWLLTNCGVDLGPVATIVPPARTPAGDDRPAGLSAPASAGRRAAPDGRIRRRRW